MISELACPIGILADGALLVGDLTEQAVQRAGGDVVVEVGVLGLDQAHLRGFACVLIIQGAQFEFLGLLGHDGFEPGGELLAGGLAEVIRGGRFATGQDALGIRHRHLLRRLFENRLGIGHRHFRRVIHGRLELVRIP